MATMLYSSTAAASASGYGSRGNSRVNGEEKGPSDVTRLFIGDFLDKPVPFPFATSLIHKGGGSNKAETTTPLRVAIHYGLGEVLVYLCQIGVNITFSTLITATLGGTVSERHLVALFEAYFRQNKDLRNSDITLVGEGVSSGSTAGPHSSSTGLPASSASSPDTLTSGVGIDLRRGLAGRPS